MPNSKADRRMAHGPSYPVRLAGKPGQLQRGRLTPNVRPWIGPDRRQLERLNDLYLRPTSPATSTWAESELDASLNGGAAQPSYSEAVLVRAARLLAELGKLWCKATPHERAEIAANLFAEVKVRDDGTDDGGLPAPIVSAKLAHDEYLALAATSVVCLARPEGFEPPTI